MYFSPSMSRIVSGITRLSSPLPSFVQAEQLRILTKPGPANVSSRLHTWREVGTPETRVEKGDDRAMRKQIDVSRTSD